MRSARSSQSAWLTASTATLSRPRRSPSRTDVSASAWRVSAAVASSCSQPCSVRMVRLSSTAPRRSSASACRSAGCCCRRFTCSPAAGRTCSVARRRISTARPPAVTDWVWRTSPTHHSCASVVFATTSTTAAAWRVPSCEISSMMTVVDGNRASSRCVEEAGDGFGVDAVGA